MEVHRLVRQRLWQYIETVAQRRGIERVTSVEWLPCRGVAEGMVLAEGSLGEASLRDHLARLCPVLLLGEELCLGVRVELEVLLVWNSGTFRVSETQSDKSSFEASAYMRPSTFFIL